MMYGPAADQLGGGKFASLISREFVITLSICGVMACKIMHSSTELQPRCKVRTRSFVMYRVF